MVNHFVTWVPHNAQGQLGLATIWRRFAKVEEASVEAAMFVVVDQQEAPLLSEAA